MNKKLIKILRQYNWQYRRWEILLEYFDKPGNNRYRFGVVEIYNGEPFKYLLSQSIEQFIESVTDLINENKKGPLNRGPVSPGLQLRVTPLPRP